MDRRSILAFPVATLVGATALRAAPELAPSSSPRDPDSARSDTGSRPSLPIAAVEAGTDREGRKRQIGVSATTYKVVTSDTKGDLFVIEQANRRRGGPPLHVHKGEDELFYVLEGEYLVQVGDKRFSLKTGDCILGPRGVPHAWAFSGSDVGRLLLSYAPAGKMEAFFNAWEQLGFTPGGYSKEKDAALLRSYGMERVGPPIQF
ncbi:cupin domain-containing protein [Sphingomonas koreensis]|nr:cupin domain-containing protein [Sphingomonas koreensis]